MSMREALPVVHPQQRRLRRGVFVTGIYDDAIAIVRLRGWSGLTAAAYERDGWRALQESPRRGSAVFAPLEAIRRFEVTPLRRRSRIRKVRVTIETDEGTSRVTTWWPAYDALYAVLGGVLGEQLVIRKARLDWRLVLILLLTVWPLVLLQVLAAFMNPEQLAGIAATFVIAGLWYTTLRLTGDGGVGLVAPRRRKERRRRRPISSRWAWPLRLVGVTLFLVVLVVNNRVGPELYTDDEMMFAIPVVLAGAYLCSLFALYLIQIGYQLGTKVSSPREAEGVASVVYLRAFDDDARHTLNRRGLASIVLGVEPLPMFGEMRPPWRYLANANPLRIVRLALGRGGDTSEEQLARFMRRWAPFVAIGRPGEAVPTAGADRMYVEDDAWQTKVRGLLARAQAVVLQPGSSAGIWWEIGEVFRTVPPERVLLVLSALGGPAGYRLFRIRFGTETGVLLPEHAGDAPFIRFDSDGTAHLAPAVHRTPFAWCVRSTTINLRKTLAAFGEGLDGELAGSTTPPRLAPRRVESPLPPPRVRPTPLSSVLASGLWYIVLTGGWTLVGAVIRDPETAFDTVEEAWREGRQGLASWFISEEEDDRYTPYNGNETVGVSPGDPQAQPPPPVSAPPAPSPAVTFRSPELGCALELGPGWGPGPSITGWSKTYSGPHGVILGVGVNPDASVGVTVEGTERWVAGLMTKSGYTNVRIAGSGVFSGEAGDYAWARVEGEMSGGIFTGHGCASRFETGILELLFFSMSSGWSSGRAATVDAALKGLRLDPPARPEAGPEVKAAVPTTATPVSYVIPTLSCALDLGPEWRADTDPDGQPVFVGPHELRLFIVASTLEHDPSRVIMARDLETEAARNMSDVGYSNVRVVGSGVSNSSNLQYVWARLDGDIDSQVYTRFFGAVPFAEGRLDVLLSGTTPGWNTDRHLAAMSVLGTLRRDQAAEAAAESK